MGIKIECSGCGFQNDLGRMFCGGCGQKLDMNATSMEDLDDRVEFDYAKLFRRLITALVLLVVFGVGGLAFWPAHIPAVFSEPAGTVQVPAKARAVRQALSYNRAIKSDFSEGELNGFLADRAKSRKLGALAIDLKPGSFDLYTSLVWTPPASLKFLASVRIPISFGMRGSFREGIMTVDKVWVGHLPLFGPARKVVTGYFATLFRDVVGEQKVVSALRSVAIEETRVELSLSP